MAWIGAGGPTVKDWLTGSNASRGANLEGLIRSSEAVCERMMIRTGRLPIANRQSLEALQGHLTSLIEAIGTVLA